MNILLVIGNIKSHGAKCSISEITHCQISQQYLSKACVLLLVSI